MGDIALTLRAVRDEALDTKTFVFDAEGLGRPVPGQYLLVKLDVPDDPRRGSRSFTMANSPTEDVVMITTRMRSGSPFKRRMAQLEPGDRLMAKGPLGRFVPREDARPSLFVAGGIGVTPFRSMIKHAIDTGLMAPAILVTSDRVPEAVPFRAELDGWAADHPWLRVARTVTRPQESAEPWSGHVGRLDAGWIRQMAGDGSEMVGYAAGPPAFVEGASAILQALGLPPDRITVERFLGY